MPIVSRTLTVLANHDAIRPTWRVDGVDAIGRIWGHGPFTSTQAEAEVTRDGVVWNLAKADRAEVLAWVQARNTVASFDYTDRDIVEDDGEEHIFRWFSETRGAEAIAVAWWMDDINTGKFNSILSRVGFTGDQGDTITSRFSSMVTVEPWYDLTIEAP